MSTSPQPLATLCWTSNMSANSMTLPVVHHNEVPRVLIKVRWALWYYYFRQRVVNTLMSRTLRWWLAALLGIASVTLSLTLSIPAISEAHNKRKDCPPYGGISDIYGIGIRIATYLQVVMTMFGEISADPKYSATLASVNLWFLWALLIALRLCTDPTRYPDVIILGALGNTISFANVGALLLPPTRKVDIETVFLRTMRWITLLGYCGIIAPTYIYVPKDPHCDFEWFFTVDSHATRNSNRIFNLVTYFLAIPVALVSLMLEGPIYHRGKIKAIVKDALLGARQQSPWWPTFLDFWFIYPLGDLKALLDTETPEEYTAMWCEYLTERYSLPPNAFEQILTSLGSRSATDSSKLHWQRITNFLRNIRQHLWTSLRALRRAKNRIDGFQARIIWNSVFLIFGVLKVELTIVANEVYDVNSLRSAGQLIAVVVSLGALAAMVTETVTRERRKLYGFPLRVREGSPDSSV